jgi:hypothetical protein
MGKARTLIDGTMRSRFTIAVALFAAGIVGGLAIGMFGPVLRILLDPNRAPVAGILPMHDIQAQVGERVLLNASPSAVPGRAKARLRFEWFDAEGDFRLLPAGIDPESDQAKQLEIYGATPGERRITLRVTNMSRCHIFTNLRLSPEQCEKSGEEVAHITFVGTDPGDPGPRDPGPRDAGRHDPDPRGTDTVADPQPCRPGRGLPADKLVLDGPRTIGAEDRNADCRLVLPGLIVTNGFELRVKDEAAVAAAAGGTRIVAFQDAPPRATAGSAGARGANGQADKEGGAGGAGEQGRTGRNAGLIVIDATRLSGALSIDNTGQAGGQGGIGGRGGIGGNGGRGTSSVVRGSACDRPAQNGLRGGNGGNGGPGGPGGVGGNGGDVRIKLAQAIAAPGGVVVHAGGGAGGAGGPGGFQGFAGDGGLAGSNDAPCPAAQKGEAGQQGLPGLSGTAGSRGVPGVFELKAGGTQVREAGALRQDEEIRIP